MEPKLREKIKQMLLSGEEEMINLGLRLAIESIEKYADYAYLYPGVTFLRDGIYRYNINLWVEFLSKGASLWSME